MSQTWIDPDTCAHRRAIQRYYLGSNNTEWYWFCPECYSTWPAKASGPRRATDPLDWGSARPTATKKEDST